MRSKKKDIKCFTIYSDDKKYDDSKFFFERDLVFNPKSEKSYLYLAKIFDESENDYEMESNLNKVLLLNPKNEEAIYLLTMLKIKLSLKLLIYSVLVLLISESLSFISSLLSLVSLLESTLSSSVNSPV